MGNGSWKGTSIESQRNAGVFLEAINPEFKEIDENVLINSNRTLELLVNDLEYYVRYILELYAGSFAYSLTGSRQFEDTLEKIVDFFKPFRVNFLDFNSIFEINDSVGDSLVFGEKYQIYNE